MAAIVPTKKYPYLYLPDDWDAGWKAAKAASATTPCWMTVIGDSVATGNTATDYLGNGWVGKLRAAILARGYTAYGDYYQSTMSNALNSASSPALPWTQTTATKLDGMGYGSTLFLGSGKTIVFTSPAACVAMDLIYDDYFACSWTYSVDGGTAVPVTQAATSGPLKKIPLTGLANTTHTITISITSGTSTIAGVVAYTSTTAGIGVAWCTTGGLESSAWIVVERQRAISNTQSTQAANFGMPGAPHLLIIAMGLNDANTQNTGAEQYYSIWRRVIHAARNARSACSVLIVADACPDALHTDQAVAGMSQAGYDWGIYLNTMQRLARDSRSAFVNFDAKWGQNPVAQGFLISGSVHPTDAGHADMASVIASIV